MKSIVTFSFCLFLVCCSEIDKLLTFRISDSISVTIPSNTLLNLPIAIPTPEVTTNSNQKFENNNTKADLVKDVKLEEAKLTITDPPSKTFSFLKSIHFYISTNSSDEIEVAFMDDIVSTSNTLNLNVTNQKLDKYIKAETYKLRTEIVMKESLTQDVDVRIDLKFRVTAESL